MAKRWKVRLYEQIRRARAQDEAVAIRELARRFEVHRRDVRAALACAVPPARKVVVRPAPKMDAWKPIVDGWLAADRDAPRKQRHTARRVWQRLVTEHDAQIGESTVRRYVAQVRARQELPLTEVTVPQTHPLGAEAEVDFGTISVYLAGMLCEVSLFVMRLSASTPPAIARTRSSWPAASACVANARIVMDGARACRSERDQVSFRLARCG